MVSHFVLAETISKLVMAPNIEGHGASGAPKIDVTIEFTIKLCAEKWCHTFF